MKTKHNAGALVTRAGLEAWVLARLYTEERDEANRLICESANMSSLKWDLRDKPLEYLNRVEAWVLALLERSMEVKAKDVEKSLRRILDQIHGCMTELVNGMIVY